MSVAGDGLAKDVSELLGERLHSFEALETLLQLQADARDWSLAEMAERLKVEPETASTALEELVAASLASSTGEGQRQRWRYSPPSATVAAAVSALVETYESSRLEVIRALTENAFDRIRSSALATFSDSFRLGPPRRKDG